MSWQLRRCKNCGHENVRNRQIVIELGCKCGSHDFALYELWPVHAIEQGGRREWWIPTDAGQEVTP